MSAESRTGSSKGVSIGSAPAVSTDILRIDAVVETERIVAGIREIVFRQLKREGVVIGVSGGIDSSVVAFLCARALGKERVLAVVHTGNGIVPR